MKTYITTALAILSLFASAQNGTLTPGQTAPDFALINVNNKQVSFKDYPNAKGFIVVFTCNTCPYSKAYEQRINELNEKYAAKGFPVIAINPNDPNASPGDSFEKMKEHAKSSKFNFPYLYDKDQDITTRYGAKSTPHVFLINKTTNGNIIEYTGAIDNDTPNTNSNKTNFLDEAVGALLKNEKPGRQVTKAIGCSVKWKRS
jgi:peroxiredoxin